MSRALRDAADSMAWTAMLMAQERACWHQGRSILAPLPGTGPELESAIIATAARLESLLGCMDRMAVSP